MLSSEQEAIFHVSFANRDHSNVWEKRALSQPKDCSERFMNPLPAHRNMQFGSKATLKIHSMKFASGNRLASRIYLFVLDQQHKETCGAFGEHNATNSVETNQQNKLLRAQEHRLNCFDRYVEALSACRVLWWQYNEISNLKKIRGNRASSKATRLFLVK
jgi:hypothetical protein